MSTEMVVADLVRLDGYLDRVSEAGQTDASMKTGWTKANKALGDAMPGELKLTSPTLKADESKFLALRFFVKGLIRGLEAGEPRRKVVIA